jgi:hypothetical protein
MLYSWPELYFYWSFPRKVVEIWSFHSDIAEDVSLLEYYAVVLCKKLLTPLRAVCTRVSHTLVHCKVFADVEETVGHWTNNTRECVLYELLGDAEEIVDHWEYITT